MMPIASTMPPRCSSDLLAAIPGKAATLALAQRAVFDLSAAVREGAVAALQRRPRDEARAVFLSSLRHPWAPAADHAAEALVALTDHEAVPRLIRLLDQPDPAELVHTCVAQFGRTRQVATHI